MWLESTNLDIIAKYAKYILIWGRRLGDLYRLRFD